MDKYNGNNIDDCIRILIPFNIRNIVGFVWLFINFMLLIILFIFPPYNIYLTASFSILCDM